MRALLVPLLLLAACATSEPQEAEPAAAALTADLFPFAASKATFADSRDPAPRTMRVEPTGDGARMVLEVAGAAPRQVSVVARAGSLFFSGGVDVGTELVRKDAKPGEEWESDGRRVRFEGWERLSLPGGNFDAAKISARRGPEGMQQVETWWFARGVGVVRMRSDHDGLFADELVLSSK